MSLNALFMCRDPQSLRVLDVVIRELGIEREICISAPEALEFLAQRYCSALIVDFDISAASQVVRMARMSPPQRRPVVFAMIGAHTDIAETFRTGANFVLFKPLTLAQVERSLRAGHGFMRPDRRRSPRHRVKSLVYLRFGDVCSLPALVLDLNADGLCVQAAEPLPTTEIPLRFILPGSQYVIEGTGDVVWADETGRAGILFRELPASSRKYLKRWAAARNRKQAAGQVPAGSQRRIPASAD
jgi:CheY-like chemotaxis protein